MLVRETLETIYLDWVNNFLTLDKYAEFNGIDVHQATKLIDLAREVYNSNHPDK